MKFILILMLAMTAIAFPAPSGAADIAVCTMTGEQKTPADHDEMGCCTPLCAPLCALAVLPTVVAGEPAAREPFHAWAAPLPSLHSVGLSATDPPPRGLA